MSIFWGLEHYIPPADGVAVTIGVFDGFHVGHQALVHRLAEAACGHGLPAIAVTMDRHPLEVVAPDRAPLLLSDPRERVERLARSGVAGVLVLRFDEVFARLDARRFVREVLLEKVGAHYVVVGQSFRFGRGREGTPELLQEMADELGFHVDVVSPVMVDGEPVSSSLVRQTLEAGDVRRAARLLGGCYSVSGVTVHGDGRGQKIGFPTANLEISPRRLLPANGVYAVNGRFNGVLLRGAANVGVRPTVGGGPRGLEVHLVGFRGELYGNHLEVRFLERLRDEKRFSSLEELAAQIRQDVARALEVPDCLEAETAASAAVHSRP
ncbi:MAG: riboflavin biosynthesis protein [Armatimonadota bacterium]|nr:MAG: riboflavin biosynthesis protein [Armatimonadota bacterium]